ncbi:MAG: 23S rRNA (pseudouridine(1915)-N(3))-methyltransferase RlmH [Lachnospiraceae bacterium]|nr:23S rRNA (pseudouridine(1915)-N(3))-methyltransferase RlmH [Lachnospiraceae bacterium]
MKVSILCAGKLKEQYLKDAMAEYSKRLSRYCKFSVLEVTDGPDMEAEAERLLKNIPSDAELFSLEIEGKGCSSPEFAGYFEECMNAGKSHICFLIGGSEGLSERVRAEASRHISFSALTFPHQLMRVILAEQIYRAFKIIAKEPYHK